jgi:hypothetical protein
MRVFVARVFHFIALGGILLGLGGCASVHISPARMCATSSSPSEIDEALGRWRAAVELSNAFLDSPWRRTLPPGKFVLGDEGMVFQSDGGEWPVMVRVTRFGDLCVKVGFAAQERSDGFVVGRTKPNRTVIIDNTFFRYPSGRSKPARAMAGVLLHETTHVVFRDGTVGFWAAVRYYAEAAATWRYRTLTAERRPYATSEEFAKFAASRTKDSAVQVELLRQFETHVAEGPTKYCRHGPFLFPLAHGQRDLPLPATR